MPTDHPVHFSILGVGNMVTSVVRRLFGEGHRFVASDGNSDIATVRAALGTS
jgi:6-phosphogluconate dehydrogenase (decarboxylating)